MISSTRGKLSVGAPDSSVDRRFYVTLLAD